MSFIGRTASDDQRAYDAFVERCTAPPTLGLVTVPLSAIPAVIAQSIRDVLRVHGLELSAEVVDELANNGAQCVAGLDVGEDQ